MNILFLGESKCTDVGAEIIDAVRDFLQCDGHIVKTVLLNSKEIKPCVACLGCWTKTPGQCAIIGDIANSVAEREINSDAIVLISEITYGGFSADIKVFLDRSLQNIMPYFVNYDGELHHPMRYKRFPIWIAIGYGDVSDAEKHTFTSLADKNALNMRPSRHLAITVQSADDIEKEFGNITKILEVKA